MKRYTDLDEYQQNRAIEKCVMNILERITEGQTYFEEDRSLQKRIDEAWSKAEINHTPWFFHEYIMETCEEDLYAMALFEALDAYYPENGEYCISGIAIGSHASVVK